MSEPAERGRSSDLFGRGMIYVLVWSMQMVVATVVSPVLTRVLPKDQFGGLAAAIALYQLLITVALFGLDNAVEMQRVEDSDPSRSRGLVATGMIMAFGVVGLCAITSPLWSSALGFPSSTGLVLVALLWTAPGGAALLTLAMLQAEDRLARFATVSLVSTVGSQLLGIGLLFLVERTALVYAWGGVIGNTVSLLLGIVWTRPRPGGLTDRATIAAGLRLGVPLMLAGVAQFVLSAGDRFVVQRMLGPEQVARYQVAYTVGNVLSLMLAFTTRAWLPRLKSITSSEQRWEVIAASRDGVYWLVGWALIGITVSAPVLLRVFAPASYDPASLVAVVLVVGLAALPVAASGATSQVLVTTRQSRPIAIGAAVAAVVKIVLTIAVIGRFGLVGTAAATTVAIAAQAWVQRVAVQRALGFRRSSATSLGFVALACLVSTASLELPQQGFWLAARFGFSCLCLAPFFLALRGLQRGTGPLPLLRHP